MEKMVRVVGGDDIAAYLTALRGDGDFEKSSVMKPLVEEYRQQAYSGCCSDV